MPLAARSIQQPLAGSWHSFRETVMRVNIRHNAYETNSSTHSVVVDPEEARDFQLPADVLRKGVIGAEVYPEGYGWQWHRFYRPENKLAYLLYQASRFGITARHGKAPPHGVDLSRDIMKDNHSRFIIETVERVTGCRVEFVFPVVGAHYYVDHDSSGNGLELAREGREDELLALLFGANSYVQMGNDNADPGEFVSSDLGDVAALEHKAVDEPLSAESFFEIEFAAGYEPGQIGSLTVGDETIEGPFSAGWAGGVTEAMRGVTVLSAAVGLATDARRLSSGVPPERRARDVFFQWMYTANKKDEWRHYADGDGPADVRVLRDAPVEFFFVETMPGSRYDTGARISFRACASHAVVSEVREEFEATVSHVERMEKAWAEKD